MKNPKIGIVISTYQRPDGQTPKLLKRTLDCLLNQTYSNWKLFLMGDHYQNDLEFQEISSYLPKENILSLNLPHAPERLRYPNGGNNLWNSAGAAAINIGIELSVNLGYDYVCHLDHDELWEPNHLEVLAKGIEDTGALMLYTKGLVLNQPMPNVQSEELYIKRRALKYNTVCSATCVNYRIIPLRRKDPLYFYNEVEPGDAAFLPRVNDLLESSNQDSILINKVTVNHDQEGYTKTLTPSQIKDLTL